MAEKGLEKMVADKVRNYRELNRVATKGETVLAGSSLMDYFPVNELLMDAGITRKVYNRGILSLTVEQYDEVLDVVLDLEPSRIFINIGTNDLSRGGDTIGNLMRRYRAMIHRIKKTLPECEITCLAYYPCLPPDHPEIRPGRISRTMESVRKANLEIEEMCRQENLRFLDLNEPLYDANGDLKEELSLDQIHFSAEGYIRVFDQLKEYLK